MQKTSIGVCFTMAYTGEKIKNKKANMVLPVSPKVAVGDNCIMLLLSMTSYKSGRSCQISQNFKKWRPQLFSKDSKQSAVPLQVQVIVID